MAQDTGLRQLLENNRNWVNTMTRDNPTFFADSAKGQQPRYLYIGCADSRVPASGILGMRPGEMFVHRNIANLVVSTDLNLLSVLQYAVEVLKVQDILVVGHYGCGGVAAAGGRAERGLIDHWLLNIRDVVRLHEAELQAIADDTARGRRLVELNVVEQVFNLAKTDIVQNALRSGRPLRLHGLVYDLATGYLTDLDVDSYGLQAKLGPLYATQPGTH